MPVPSHRPRKAAPYIRHSSGEQLRVPILSTRTRPRNHQTNPSQFKRFGTGHYCLRSPCPKDISHQIPRNSRDRLRALLLSACIAPIFGQQIQRNSNDPPRLTFIPVSTALKKTGRHIQRSSRDLLPALILSACSGPKIRPPHPAQFRRSAKGHDHSCPHRPQEIERHIRRDSDTPARVMILSVPTVLKIRPPPPAQLAQSVTDTDLFRALRPEISAITSHAANAICCGS